MRTSHADILATLSDSIAARACHSATPPAHTRAETIQYWSNLERIHASDTPTKSGRSENDESYRNVSADSSRLRRSSVDPAVPMNALSGSFQSQLPPSSVDFGP